MTVSTLPNTLERSRRTTATDVRVLGWGTALPPHAYRQRQVAEHLGRSLGAKRVRRLRAAFRGSRVVTRHSVLPDFRPECADPELFAGSPTTSQRLAAYRRHAPGLAERAARAALDASGIEPGEVTHLLFVTCTGFYSPGPDRDLVLSLGLDPAVRRVQIGFQGCSAGIVGLRTASEIARGDASARVLVVACEISSVHFQSELSDEDLRAHALFADGAAAALVGAGHGEGGRVRLREGVSLLLPDSAEQMTWDVAESGFLMSLSSRIPESLSEHLPRFLARFPDRDYRHWAIHPGGPRVLDRLAETLALPEDALEASRAVLRDCGNMSSATVLFVLDRIAAAAAEGPGLAVAFGPGLTAEGLAFDVVGSASDRT